MIVGVVKETFAGERRVALTPDVLPLLIKEGLELLIESGAGDAAGFPDTEYEAKGGQIVADKSAVFGRADVVCQVRTFSANTDAGHGELGMMRSGQVVIGLAEPLTTLEPIQKIAATGARLFALELIPRTTRGQAMDVLSSQATIAGYKAVALATDTLAKMFPMMMTAAGTIKPVKAFIIGAGVAGLQCIASAKRAGAIVSAFDVRPEVKEQIESLGAKFVEIEVADASGEGGYARELTEDEKKKQRELMADTVAGSDVVITTAAVPGKKAPMLIPSDVVNRMKPGSLIVDMAAERGGNCQSTRPNETVVQNGVTIVGPTNMASTIPYHASQMFSKNVSNLLKLLVKDGELSVDMEDDIIAGTLETDGGEIIHPMAREVFGLPKLEAAAAAATQGSDA